VSIVADTARFAADDCEPLVRASLACPLCLHGDTVEWQLVGDGYEPSVECSCGSCHERWSVYLTPWQALRLSLMGAHARRG
jgi:hypothetical protein